MLLCASGPGSGSGAPVIARSIARQPRARRAVGLPRAHGPLLRPAEVQLAFGAAQRDIEKALLLGERIVGLGVGDGHQAALEPGDVDGVELETLGPVEGEQLDRAATARAPRVAARRGGRGLAAVVAAKCLLQELEVALDGAGAASESRYSSPSRSSASTCSAPLLGQVVGVGDEIGEVVGEGARSAPPGRPCAARRARPSPRAGRGSAHPRARGTEHPRVRAPPRTAPTAR